jgi:hypothetical protein
MSIPFYLMMQGIVKFIWCLESRPTIQGFNIKIMGVFYYSFSLQSDMMDDNGKR